jgi:hypothetical protein
MPTVGAERVGWAGVGWGGGLYMHLDVERVGMGVPHKLAQIHNGAQDIG